MRNRRSFSFLFCAAFTASLICAGCGSSSGDGEKGSSSRQVLQNKGSDTLVNVAQAWAEAYGEVNPQLAVAVTGGGSGTGIAALLNGTVDLANSSRSMKDKEIKLAQSKGIEPVENIVGYDALAVFLHKDNPIDTLTIEQIRSIYGENGTVEKWSDLGVTVPGCSSDKIIRVSRQNNSGTYAYFKKAVREKMKPKAKKPAKPIKKRFRSVSVRHDLCLHTAPNQECEMEEL